VVANTSSASRARTLCQAAAEDLPGCEKIADVKGTEANWPAVASPQYDPHGCGVADPPLAFDDAAKCSWLLWRD